LITSATAQCQLWMQNGSTKSKHFLYIVFKGKIGYEMDATRGQEA